MSDLTESLELTQPTETEQRMRWMLFVATGLFERVNFLLGLVGWRLVLVWAEVAGERTVVDAYPARVPRASFIPSAFHDAFNHFTSHVLSEEQDPINHHR